MLAMHVTEWLIPLVVALAAPLVSYFVAARKLSGRIGTSEAALLWKEAHAMRSEYRERAQACEAQVKVLRNELQTVIAANWELRRQIRELHDRS